MRSRLLRLLPGIAVTLGFTVWFLRTAHWSEVWQALQGVSVGWVVVSVLVLFSEFVIRTARWRILLAPLAPHRPFGPLFSATTIGMALNVVLPFRAGDFARPWLGSRVTGTSMLPLFTVAVLERVFDILGLLSVFVLMLAVLPANAQAHGELVSNLKLYGSIFGVAGVLGLGTFLVLAANRAVARKAYIALLSPFPAPVRQKFITLFDGFADGLESVRDPRALVLSGLLSMLHWLNGALSIYALFFAFGLDLPFAAACFTTVAIALTVALPQAPGFFGVFHVAIANTLMLWGQSEGPSAAFAVVFWGVSFLPVTTVGAFFWWREGLSAAMMKAEMSRMEDRPSPSDPLQ